MGSAQELTHEQVVKGSGGGGGKGGGGGDAHTPTESPDSLRSKQVARVVDLISEGEIGGLVNGLQSVYLDDVPVQNADGSNNFEGVTITERTGTQAQSFIPGFPSVEAEKAVSVKVTYATSVTRAITNSNIDAVRVTIGVPRLTHSQTNGDLVGSSFQFAIDVQSNGGGFVTQLEKTINGKTTSRYQSSYRINLTGSSPWDVRVRRLSEDSGGAQTVNDFYWESYTEIIDQKLRYPNSAVIGVEVDAEQFNRIPRRGYDCLLLKVQIPDNYDPITRTYTGNWSGTFTTAWTDNPAWCWYDMVTNPRYGLGDFIDASEVDKWALYDIAKECDVMVDDGFGGTEPQFVCGLLYLQTRDEAITVINDMASIFRGISWWSAGAVTAGMDKAGDVTARFNNAAVIDGMFNYSGSALRARHTVALVTWNDPADRYRQKIEYVEDEAGISLYGIRSTEVRAVGCTSRGQAHRVGRWLLYSERMETETVSFRAGLAAKDLDAVYPGALIEIQDADRAGARFGGRVLAVNGAVDEITLDESVTLSSGQTYTLNCVLPDNTVESRSVTNGAGTHTVLTVASAFSDTPQVHSLWTMGASNLALEAWRVVSLVEIEDHLVDVTALEYQPSKYAAITQDLLLEPLPTSLFQIMPDAPVDLVATEAKTLVAPGVVAALVVFSWQTVVGAAKYRVIYKVDDGNPVILEPTANSIDISPATAGTYDFQVQALSALGIPSPVSTLSQTISGLGDSPTEPQNLTISGIGGMALLRWDVSTDLDVTVGGFIEFRHSPLTSGASWNAATSIGDALPGYETTASMPLLSGTYLAKFRDSSEVYSDSSASVVTDGATILAWTSASTINEHTAFNGSHSNTVGLDGLLKLDGTDLMDSWGNLDDVTMWDSEGGVVSAGTYDFASNLDMGSVTRVRLQKILQATAVNVSDFIDSRTDNMDDWADFDGTLGGDADATVWVAYTDDDPAASPTWSAWQRLDSAEFEARGFKFQVRLTSSSPIHNIHVSQLGVTKEELA